ncbi:hypothetical protein GY12_05335 [Micrococcus luteus]|nr:hypothetical protein GY12_05335 [Micrococcus luteus]
MAACPPDIATELVAAARVAADLDTRMERLHDQVQETDRDDDAAAAWEDDGGPAFEDEPTVEPGEARPGDAEPGDDAPGASTV